jgi:hypothetical protein
VAAVLQATGQDVVDPGGGARVQGEKGATAAGRTGNGAWRQRAAQETQGRGRLGQGVPGYGDGGTRCSRRGAREKLGPAMRGGDAAGATGKERCRAGLNRLRDIVLGSNSDEDKDAATHWARTHS